MLDPEARKTDAGTESYCVSRMAQINVKKKSEIVLPTLQRHVGVLHSSLGPTFGALHSGVNALLSLSRNSG